MKAVSRAWQPWMGPVLMVLGTVRVWVGLDEPGFLAWYLDTLLSCGLLALLVLVGVAVWSVANRGGRDAR